MTGVLNGSVQKTPSIVSGTQKALNKLMCMSINMKLKSRTSLQNSNNLMNYEEEQS